MVCVCDREYVCMQSPIKQLNVYPRNLKMQHLFTQSVNISLYGNETQQSTAFLQNHILHL